ncbi:MAG: HsdM family class I SAM-dependent methyltransferase, partial [Pyrinomonadaceae bacterium]
MSEVFKENLKELDFESSNEDRALLLVSQINDDNLTPTEIFALEDAKEFKAAAVYFRHFKDGRSAIPQIYLYDNTEGDLDDKKTAEIHRDLWSYSRIPMFIVIEKTDVKIFDARKPVDTSGDQIKTSPIVPAINIASDAIKLYSRKLFDSGVFWESEKARGHFLESTSAYSDLIKNLKTIRQDKFVQEAGLSKKIANKLLVFSILIKYLEERGNQNDENSARYENRGLFARDFFKTNFDAENFCDVIKQGKIIALFDELSRHFNGKIFEWSEDRELVQNTNLTELALFLYGDIDLDKGQYSFWRKYSFAHLPVEVISSVYEELLNERKDAVYTPEFLVNTLIDESMPQKEFKKTSVKTIDVSCGSGIFLVSAFKRLAQRHRYAKFKKTGKLERLKSKELLQIIKANIFGVDIEEDARRLTVFSLCLALCDELKPKEIWKELKFDDTFQTNFITDNFFTYLENNEDKLGTFDLVIGNPPFISLSKAKNGNWFKDEDEDGNVRYFGIYKVKNSEGKIETKEMDVNKDINSNSRKQIYPDNQTALMFLDQSPRLLKENGSLCLIMPAAPLLYNNSFEFRKHFFPKQQVYQILDFTNLRNFLYGKSQRAKVPTVAIFTKNKQQDNEKLITHITVRRTKTTENKIFFEIDKYDFHYVSQRKALTEKHVWKCNLLGGGRLHNLISRLSDNQTINDYLSNKIKEGWHVGEGYIASSNRNFDEADYITGKQYLPSEAFTENGFDKNQITIEHSQFFERPRVKELFTPPLMLIKENIGKSKKKIPIGYSDEYLTFRQTIVGIASPEEDLSQLLELYEYFEQHNTILRLFASATSNVYLVSRDSYLPKQDIMNLPYPEDKEEINLSFVEKVLSDDVLEFYSEIDMNSSEAKFNKDAHKNNLEEYGEVFSKMLNSVYGKSGKCFYLKKIYDWNEFFVTEFNYGENSNDVEFEKIDEPTEHIKSLIETEYG